MTLSGQSKESHNKKSFVGIMYEQLEPIDIPPKASNNLFSKPPPPHVPPLTPWPTTPPLDS